MYALSLEPQIPPISMFIKNIVLLYDRDRLVNKLLMTIYQQINLAKVLRRYVPLYDLES